MVTLTQFVKNLKEVLNAGIIGVLNTNLSPWIVRLIACVGNKPVSNVVVPRAFEVTFPEREIVKYGI